MNIIKNNNLNHQKYKVDNAIILAAGMSSRFVPLSYERPKGLLVVKGERLIERQIRQLKEAGIDDITVVVGYLKEQFFYLEEKFGVKIVVNEDYYRYNNTSSLMCVADKLANTYICSSDNYYTENVFEKYVEKAYYSAVFADGKTDEYCLSFNNDGLITNVNIGGEKQWYMLGHVYFDRDFSKKFVEILKEEYTKQITKEELWENMYMRHIEELPLYIKKYDDGIIYEFDSLKELQQFDKECLKNINSDILDVICSTFNCDISDINDIKVLKFGMTNKSFEFSCNGCKYIMRVPGEGTDLLINRFYEAENYKAIGNMKISDKVKYINSSTGYKITEFIDGARVCNPWSKNDLFLCMSKLRNFHNRKIKVKHEFKLFEQINFYENLWKENKSVYDDYEETKYKVFSLKKFIDRNKNEYVLTHIDAVPDNFLLTDKDVYLIDWEYAGMQDPDLDIAMFCIYAGYDKTNIDNLIDIYFENNCDIKRRLKIYCYIACGGLLWSNWCEYKHQLGVDFGEYARKQYNYAKNYSDIIINEID